MQTGSGVSGRIRGNKKVQTARQQNARELERAAAGGRAGRCELQEGGRWMSEWTAERRGIEWKVWEV